MFPPARHSRPTSPPGIQRMGTSCAYSPLLGIHAPTSPPRYSEDGDIVYIFPELMKTAGSASLPRGVAAAGGALAADTGGGRLAVWEALAWPDAPRSWRPRLGEEVVIAEIDSKR